MHRHYTFSTARNDIIGFLYSISRETIGSLYVAINYWFALLNCKINYSSFILHNY